MSGSEQIRPVTSQQATNTGAVGPNIVSSGPNSQGTNRLASDIYVPAASTSRMSPEERAQRLQARESIVASLLNGPNAGLRGTPPDVRAIGAESLLENVNEQHPLT